LHLINGEFKCGFKAAVAAALILVAWAASPAQEINDLVFLHHSCGANWLSNSLDAALTAKSYIDERNDITYGTAMASDTDRPSSLGGTPGNSTDMCHWIYWFNDYLDHVKAYDCATGFNRIIMFKSCYPLSDVSSDGTEPGNPFSGTQSLANYKDVNAHRARLFNNWLKNEWLPSYNAAHPALDNVAVLDWFNFLANPDDHATYPNRLKEEYGGSGGDSHPNGTANSASTVEFITKDGNFLDTAWNEFNTNSVVVETKVFLEGSYQAEGSMSTALRTAGSLPLTSPYSDDPRTVASIPANAVDWVLVQVRSTLSGATIDSKSAFLASDGSIVSDNGTTLKFGMDAADGDYYLVIRHRNHTAGISAGAHALARLSSSLFDFSTGADQFHGGDAKLLETGVYGLYSGDVDGSGTVDANDRSQAWNDRNLTGYQDADCDLSGTVDANDRSTAWNNRNKTTNVP
jgi:hypothetical protein